MTELLPSREAERLTGAITEYVTTSIGLADRPAQHALEAFLRDRDTGMFTGPYLRSRMPFADHDDADGTGPLAWLPGDFHPYAHQAAAFARLSTDPRLPGPRDGAGLRLPEPTLVTTGTGSGKTESFLYPILDHVRRARTAGIGGVKALLLYPMNALANDQASRLATLITGDPALHGIRAALYTGEAGAQPRTTVTADGLITSREVIRSEPPDVLLTNYKMLDQLLLRQPDRRIWERSATSLRYLVLDEFHTYDGAQGTDVALLLRRLRIVLDAIAPGRVHLTPVATSATLGDESADGGQEMRDFAETVFAQPFDADAVVTETRRGIDEWTAPAVARVAAAGLTARNPSAATFAQVWDNLGYRSTAQENSAASDSVDPEHLTEALLNALWTSPAHIGNAEVAGDRDETADEHEADDRHGVEDKPDADIAQACTIAARRGVSFRDLAAAHPLIHDLLRASARPVRLDTIARSIFGEFRHSSEREAAITDLFAVLAHLRSTAGRNEFPSFETHLWVRELSRLDRVAQPEPEFRWSDDYPGGQDPIALPAIHCRECGRAGWGVLLENAGDEVIVDPAAVRTGRQRNSGRFRALLTAPTAWLDAADGDGDGDATESGAGETLRAATAAIRYLDLAARRLESHAPETDVDDEHVLPVVAHVGIDAGDLSASDTCPACGTRDAIRFTGARTATLLSTSLSVLFGEALLDAGEKKALVFTDSVQDAAHRAGFVESRSHALTLRSVIRAALTPGGPDGAGSRAPAASSDAVSSEGITLPALTDRILATATTEQQRYRLLHPAIAGLEQVRPYWNLHDATLNRKRAAATRRVARRLRFDVAREVGLDSATGRTLITTGSAAASVRATPAELHAAGRRALESAGRQGKLFMTSESVDTHEVREDSPGPGEPDDAAVIRWTRGVLEHMRTSGAIDHEWLGPFRREGGKLFRLWGGRPERDLMPAFPRNRALPELPSIGTRASNSVFSDAAHRQSWYTAWTAHVLGEDRARASSLVRPLLQALADAGLVNAVVAGNQGPSATHGSSATGTNRGGLTSYALPPDRVEVQALDAAALGTIDRPSHQILTCTDCGYETTGLTGAMAQLAGGPCLMARCTGTLRPASIRDNFYRSLYGDGDMLRVIAREHTSLLDTERRLEYEHDFKASATTPGAPNVLVATPTLEMGIDIGDLSTVMLAGLPRSVASYLQRVGRAGRLTGNALDLAFASGRGQSRSLLSRPEDMLDGRVRPPATYLSAAEILRRQYLAFLCDRLAGIPDAVEPPRTASGLMRSSEPGTYLGALIADAEANAHDRLAKFLGTFREGQLEPAAEAELREWATPGGGGEPTPIGASQVGGGTGGSVGQATGGTVERGAGGSAGDQGRSSALATTIRTAVSAWNRELEEIGHRRRHVEQTLRDVEANPRQVLDRTLPEAHEKESLQAELELLDLRQEDLTGEELAEVEHATRRLRGSLSRLRGDQSHTNTEHWIAVMERYGLLPNFTLVDDAVSLDVTLTWREDDNTYRHEESSLSRGGISALTELAPEAHFYAHGRNLEIDAVDLGVNQSAVTTMAFCPACGHATDLTSVAGPLLECPRCHDSGIADSGQHLSVVELSHVYSSMDRAKAAITDASDERERVHFETALAVDLGAGHAHASWTATDTGVGVRYHRTARLMHLNLGARRDGGTSFHVGGQEHRATGFRLCDECGHRDLGAGANSYAEHQPWCSHRYDGSEHVRDVVLSRTLDTEAVMISLPPDVAADTDPAALVSLRAAIELGLRERLGGTPDHIRISAVSDTERGGADGILLHDIVPGGTGYLADFADPHMLWDVLCAAEHVLATCSCRDEGLAACHHCLLPYVRSSQMAEASRAVALRHVQTMLGAGSGAVAAMAPDEDDRPLTWTIQQGTTVIAPTESSLEQAFRAVFRRMVASLPGAELSSDTSDRGEVLYLRYQGRRFTLTPQVDAAGSRPDFMLTWPGAPVPGVALFLDGREFHASGGHNRLADDAEKRSRLRDAGYIVLGLTHADVAMAGQRLDWVDQTAKRNDAETAAHPMPSLPDASFVDGQIMAVLVQFGILPADAPTLVASTGIEILLYLIRHPVDLGGLPALAALLPVLLRDAKSRLTAPAAISAEAALAAYRADRSGASVADALTGGGRLPGEPADAGVAGGGHRDATEASTLVSGAGAPIPVTFRRRGHLAALLTHDQGKPDPGIVLLLDDSEDAVDSPGFAEAWQGWLRLSNLLQTRSDVFTSIATTTGTREDEPSPIAPLDLPAEWQDVLAGAEPEEARFLRDLAAAGTGVPVPELGVEAASGYPIDVAWEDRRVGVLLADADAEERDSLEADGWTILGPDADTVAAALVASGTGTADAGRPADDGRTARE